jgi:hypothetical protein
LTPRGQHLQIIITEQFHRWGCCTAHSEVKRNVQHRHHTCIILLQRCPPTPLHQALGDPNACGGAEKCRCFMRFVSRFRLEVEGWSNQASIMNKCGVLPNNIQSVGQCHCARGWGRQNLSERHPDHGCNTAPTVCGGLFFLGRSIPNAGSCWPSFRTEDPLHTCCHPLKSHQPYL